MAIPHPQEHFQQWTAAGHDRPKFREVLSTGLACPPGQAVGPTKLGQPRPNGACEAAGILTDYWPVTLPENPQRRAMANGSLAAVRWKRNAWKKSQAG
ncbi:unnamed protein product [Prunus armeniaca]